MRTPSARYLLVGLLALAVVGAPLASAASAASLTASPATPGEVSTHTATVTVGSTSAGSLTGFAVDYGATGANASNVGVEDVTTVGIDRGDDASGDTVDVTVSDDLSSVSASNGGSLLQFSFGGSYSLNESDEVVVVYGDVQNPAEAGDYTVPLDINYQSSGGEANATLAVGSSTATATATDSAMTTETTDADSTTDTATATAADEGDATTEQPAETEANGGSGDGDGSGEDTSSGSGPGFGPLAVVGALAAIALLALRGN